MVAVNFIEDEGGVGIKALFGKPLNGTKEYLKQSVNQFVDAVGGAASGVADFVIDRFNHVTSAGYEQRIENMRNRLNNNWQVDTIKVLRNYEEIQEAPPVMQRWIMANPNLRQHYNNGNLSGWDGTYVDFQPGTIGETQYEYRRVMDGVIHRNEDDQLVAVNYHEKLLDGDEILSILNKTDILTTWSTIDKHLDESIVDPTSPFNENIE